MLIDFRSQSNAENSKPTVIAPIVTLDFGYVGQHHVTIIPRDGKYGKNISE